MERATSMKRFLSLSVSVLTLAQAHAQAPSPAQMGITPSTVPEVLQVLDNAQSWVPIGSVDPTTHTAIGLGKEFYVRQFGPHNDWVSDDGPAIAAALNAASAAGGGTVYLDQTSYWNQTQALIVPKNVRLTCVGAFTKRQVTNDYTAFPCTIYQKAGTTLKTLGSLTNIGVLQDQAHFQPMVGATRARMETFVAGFAGVGVQIGNADAGITGTQAIVQNVLIGGFATCVVQNGAAQVQMRQVLGDCTNGLDLAGSYDNNFLSDIEFWEFLTTAQTATTTSWPITAIANNGGLWRVTLGTPTPPAADPPATGEQMWVNPGLGSANQGGMGASGQWTITAVNSTTIDLQTSVVSPTTTGNTTTGRTYVTVASTNDLAAGVNVSGAGIPAGAKIAAVWRTRPAISLDQAHPATATASGVTLTFASDAYVSGGTVTVDNNWRNGTGFAIGHADGTSCSGCFAYGYLIGFNFRGGSFNNFTNSNVDGTVNALANKNVVPISVEFTGDANATVFQTSALTTGGVHILSNPTTTGAGGSNFVSAAYPPGATYNSTYLEHAAGGLTFRDLSVSYGGSILLDNSAVNPSFFNLNMPNAMVYGTTVQPQFYGAGNVLGGNLEATVAVSHKAQSLTVAANSGNGVNVNFYDATQALDSKYWRLQYGSGTLCLQTVNDAYNAVAAAWCASRSANSVTKTVMFAPLGFAQYSIATLPPCVASLLGTVAYVNNGQASPPYLGAVSTTGTVVAPVFCNGSGWVYH
jgi:hypothetical protein